MQISEIEKALQLFSLRSTWKNYVDKIAIAVLMVEVAVVAEVLQTSGASHKQLSFFLLSQRKTETATCRKIWSGCCVLITTTLT